MRNIFRSIIFVAAAGLLAYWPAAQATGFYTANPYNQSAPRAPGFDYYGYYHSGNHQRGYGFDNRAQGFYGRNDHRHGLGPNSRNQLLRNLNRRGYNFYDYGFQQPRVDGYLQFDSPRRYQRRYRNFQRHHYNRLRRHR